MSSDVITNEAPTVRIPGQISQVTAIEQARAVAEVAAAVRVAQDNPRDRDRALADMRESCSRTSLASRAFYSVPNRGEGPSVHLARELARIWGNVDFGVRELRRDDARGESEVLAYAADLQTNVRSTRSFIVPHVRMKKINGKQTRQPLVDLTDVYLNNQNNGAKAVRECIFSMLPGWFVDEAKDLCQQTLANGDGRPLDVRIDEMATAFDKTHGVTVDQLEAKIGRKRGQWNANDVARMGVVFSSLSNGDTTRDDEFPPKRVTAAEITGKTEPDDVPAGGLFGDDSQQVPDA